MGGGRVGQLGSGPADVTAQDEQVGLGVGPVGRVLEGLTDGGFEPVDVVGHFSQVADPPAVGLKASDRVVAVGQLGRPVDRDVVVVVDGQEPAQPQVTGQGRCLVRDPLHEAAVAGDDKGAVVTHVGTEGCTQPAFGNRQPDCVADALSQRACRDFDAGGVAGLWVPRCTAAPFAELA